MYFLFLTCVTLFEAEVSPALMASLQAKPRLSSPDEDSPPYNDNVLLPHDTYVGPEFYEYYEDSFEDDRAQGFGGVTRGTLMPLTDANTGKPSIEGSAKHTWSPVSTAETPLTLERAIELFKNHHYFHYPTIWRRFYVDGCSVYFTFKDPVVSGNTTFSDFAVNMSISNSWVAEPTHTINDKSVVFNFRYKLDMVLRTAFHCYVDSEYMMGYYYGNSNDIDLNVKVEVMKHQFGACLYEEEINLVPKDIKGRIVNSIPFKSRDMTQRVEIIVHTFVLRELLVNKLVGVVYNRIHHDISSQIHNLVRSAREELKWILCDFFT